MEESRWEASRRQERKKVFFFLFFFILIVTFVTILFLNNRDLIDPSGSGRSRQANESAAENEPKPAEVTVTHENALPSPEPSVSPLSVSNDFHQVLPQQPSTGLSAAAETSPSAADTPETKKRAVTDAPRLFSIELPSFPCRIENRKDVVIYLSLELFFNDSEKRTAIFFHRDDIKVIVLRTLRDKELTEMKKAELESQLLHDINRLFDHADITAVKIRNIHVEKAVKE